MVFLTIWPIFALICLGFFLARASFINVDFWPVAERLNYFILFPALLLSSLADAPLNDPEVYRLGGAAAATILIAALGLSFARRSRPTSAARFGPAVQGIIRFNTYLGFAVVLSLQGAEGTSLAAVYLAIAIPLVNVLSIVALTEKTSGRKPLDLLRTILKNPLILACLAGIALALIGAGLPFGMDKFFDLLAQGSLPLGLLCIGAALQPAAIRHDMRILAGVSFLRLLCIPVLALIIALVLGLESDAALVLVIFSAVPAAPTAYILTRQLGGDGSFMARIITAQTLLAALSLPLILYVFSNLPF